MSVATPPGGAHAAATASQASEATSAVRSERRTHADTGRASESISDSSGESRRLCQVA